MKRITKQMKFTLNRNRMAGGMLLEVVLAIAVFAFGMLALVQLQGNLTRSSADANTRTVATNIAEEIVERIRGFKQVAAIADNGEVEFMELTGTAQDVTVSRGGMDYDVTFEIFDFWRDDANDNFVRNAATDPPTVPSGLGGAYASFKLLKIDVAWNTAQDFYVDDDNTAVLGPGNITLYEIIPNSPPILGAKIAGDPNAAGGAPVVYYTPGANPDIVALTLDDGGKRRKESTTPDPDIKREAELTETYFEVVSYNDANVYLRREEFLTVGCECELNPNSGAPDFGLRPTVWNGVEYTEGEAVSVDDGKDVAVSANHQQSFYCEVCCRDHHDGGAGANDNGKDANDIQFEAARRVYNPWDYSSAAQNHPHYARSTTGPNKGTVTVAGDGDIYLESCRMIRVDGFWRVAQDFNQQVLVGVVADYMDEPDEVGEYSAYVTAAAEDFYENSPAGLAQPGDSGITGMPEFTNPEDGLEYPLLPATDDDVAQAGPNTYLPGPVGLDESKWPQLRSRGIYPDYMTNEVAGKIATCVPLDFEGNPPDGCQIPHFLDPLEVYPFFEVQVTKLANWAEDPIGMPVKVTNFKIASGNTHSRGKAELKQIGMGKTKANHAIHKGNNGIAATSSIRPVGVVDPQAADIDTDFVHIDTTDDGSEPPTGVTISGDITIGVPGNLSISNMDLTHVEAECGITTTGYECIIPTLSGNPTMTLSGYEQNNKIRYACSDQLVELAQSTDDTNSWTTFDLSGTVPATALIVIQNTPCPDLP